KHAETFIDLQTVCTFFHVVFKLSQHSALPLGIVNGCEVHVGKNDESFRLRLFDILNCAFQVLGAAASATTQVNHHGHVQFIHGTDQCVQILRRHVKLVIMDIDKRILRTGYPMFGHDKC